MSSIFLLLLLSVHTGLHSSHEGCRLWFDTEEDFFKAASKCASLYFLPERRIFFGEKALLPPGAVDGQSGSVYRVLQRGSEQEIVDDNTGGAVYDASIVLSRYLAVKEADKMEGTTVLVTCSVACHQFCAVEAAHLRAQISVHSSAHTCIGIESVVHSVVLFIVMVDSMHSKWMPA